MVVSDYFFHRAALSPLIFLLSIFTNVYHKTEREVIRVVWLIGLYLCSGNINKNNSNKGSRRRVEFVAAATSLANSGTTTTIFLFLPSSDDDA